MTSAVRFPKQVRAIMQETTLFATAWKRRDELRVRKVDYYDRKDAHLKTLTVGGYERYLDRYWRAAEMTMVNHVTGKSTVLTWTDYQFHTDLDERDFTRTGLKRVR